MTSAQILATIKATEISSRDYRMLTDGANDAVGLRCVEKALTWVLAKHMACGKEADLTSDLVIEAWIKRALYELYSFSENERVARDKAEDALTYLASALGDCVQAGEAPGGDGGPTVQAVTPATGIVKTGTVPDFLTGYRHTTWVLRL